MKIYTLKLKIPWPFFEVNVYLLEDEGEYVLIDTGFFYEENFKELNDFVQKICGWEKIKFIVLTHGHPDHYGNIKNIFEIKRIPVLLHPKDKDRVVDIPKEERKEGALWAYKYLKENGVPEDKMEIITRQSKSYFTSKYRIQEEDVFFEDEIFIGGTKFKIFHTPGHTPGHIILYDEKDAIVFVGDHLFSKGFPVPLLFFTKKEDRFQNLPAWISSLEILEEIEVNVVYPGHLEPFSNVKDVISKMKKRVEKMKGKVYEIISQQPMTLFDIGQKLYPHIPDEYWSFKFSEAQGYIDLLERENLVRKIEKDSVIYYTKI